MQLGFYSGNLRSYQTDPASLAANVKVRIKLVDMGNDQVLIKLYLNDEYIFSSSYSAPNATPGRIVMVSSSDQAITQGGFAQSAMRWNSVSYKPAYVAQIANPLPGRLQSWWDFDYEATTDLEFIDATGNGHDLLARATVGQLTVTGGVQGGLQLRRMAAQDAISQPLFLPYQDVTAWRPSSSFSFGGWLTPAGTSTPFGAVPVITHSTSSAKGTFNYEVVQINNVMRFRVSTNGSAWTFNLDSPSALEAGVRKFYIFSYNRIDNLMELWVGSEGGSTLQTVTLPITGNVANNFGSWSTNLTLGCYFNSDQEEPDVNLRWPGTYDSVFYVSNAMSTDLANFIYNSGAGRKYSQMAGAPLPVLPVTPPGSGTFADPWLVTGNITDFYISDSVPGWFKVHLEPGRTLTIGTGSGLDSKLALFDQNGTLLRTDDDGGNEWGGNSGLIYTVTPTFGAQDYYFIPTYYPCSFNNGFYVSNPGANGLSMNCKIT